jgi:dipeptidyl-peptidase-4
MPHEQIPADSASATRAELARQAPRPTRLLPDLLACLALSPVFGTLASAEPLTVERIFSAPDLSGPRLTQPKLSPDGRYVTYLQGKEDNKDQLDLWAFDTRTGASRMLVDSRALLGGKERLSAEEEARRERQRTASLRGIVEYQFSSDGRRLLIPLGGELYVYDLSARERPVRQLTRTEAYETDARFSPKGTYVSFIRDQDLFVIEVATGKEQAITTDGEGLVQNGVAEFIAQEEMGRDTGYWWSPDERRIAYTRIDDSPVQEVERIEIHADGARVLRQRYPAAGTANTKVELKIVELGSRRVTPVDLGSEDVYLARVDWFPDSKHMAVQRQSRDQKTLELLKVHAETGAASVLLTETGRSWIELHDDLRFLEKRSQFIWASRRSGFNHLYLYDFEGRLIRPLTAGEWMVTGDGTESGIVGIDEEERLVYFLANEASPLERHLYVQSLDTSNPQRVRRISREPGWHDARLVPKGGGYLDVWSSPERPPSASLRKLDGTVRHWIVRNQLDESHPYHRYWQDHVTEEFGSIRASDGQELHYRLLKPRTLMAGARYPVVIDTYGGPHFQYVRKDWMGGARAAQGYFRQVLAQHGFVVFTLDNRGSGFRGTAFESALQGQFGKVELDDQLQGVEFLKQQPYVDPERIGIMGWSYGGYMALIALTNSSAFKAGVAGAPVTDWRLYDTHYTERYIGTPMSNPDGYEGSAVLPRAQQLKGRLLLVHGMADDNVLFTHSTMLMDRLQTAGLQFDLMTYPGSKHGLIRMPGTGRHYYEAVLQFFQREL